MRECVVGIHGNGVAAEIWQQEEGRAFRLDRRWRPGLVSRWQEGDSLSEAGEQWLCHTLEEARRWAKELCCQSVQGLGGSPLRYSGGRLGLEDRLGQALGAPVQTLSGEQAADLLRQAAGPGRGVLCRVGGGSVQLVRLEEPGCQQSLPLGPVWLSRRMTGPLLTMEETLSLRQEIQRLLREEAGAFAGGVAAGGPVLFCGQALWELGRVQLALCGGGEGPVLEPQVLARTARLLRSPDLGGLELLERQLPHTAAQVLPVIELVRELADFLQAGECRWSPISLEEGWALGKTAAPLAASGQIS